MSATAGQRIGADIADHPGMTEEKTVSEPTCEVSLRWEPTGQDNEPYRIAEYCGKPAVWRYPAMGGGFMHLCAEHGEPHRSWAEAIHMEAVAGMTEEKKK